MFAGTQMDGMMMAAIAVVLAISVPARPDDCNWNGVDDLCDISCVAQGCTKPCGGSEDCNGNGTPDECDTASVFVGTRSAETGLAKVYRYNGGTDWIDLSPDGLGKATTVMALRFYQTKLYAGTQTMHGHGGDYGVGQVWRNEGGNSWSLVGIMDNSVMMLDIYDGSLFVGTNLGGLFRCTECDGTDWESIPGGSGGSGFQSSIVSSVCGPAQLFLGELNVDDFWRYTLDEGLIELESHEGSCVWDFAEYENRIYAGAFAGSTWQGPVYATFDPLDCDSRPMFEEIHTTGKQNWAVESFRNYLYVGTGGIFESPTADLWRYDGEVWQIVHQWPTFLDGEGVSAMAAHGSEALFIGLGLRDGYDYLGDGRGEMWLFDGMVHTRISDPDFFDAGVQTILIGGFAPDCNRNRVIDDCEVFDDCNDNGVIDECEEDCNANGYPDDCDIAEGRSDDGDDNSLPDECGCGRLPGPATILREGSNDGTIDARQPHPRTLPICARESVRMRIQSTYSSTPLSGAKTAVSWFVRMCKTTIWGRIRSGV